MWVSVVSWEVRRLRCGGGGSVLTSTEGGRLRGAAALEWRAVGCGVGEADVGVGGGLRGAAALERRRRLGDEKHGGRLTDE